MAQKPRGRPRTNPDAPEQTTVQALDRALILLAHVASHPGRTLSDLAQDTGLPIATVFRALSTLQAHAMVETEDPGQFWHIGPGALRIGSAFRRRTGLVERARQPMQRLVQATGETAGLAVPVSGEVLFLAQAEGHQPLRALLAPGVSAPMHCTAAGKALLAWQDEDAVRRVIAARGLPRMTSLTLTGDSALLRDLARTRDRGFAIDDQEQAEGMRSVSAPVFDEAGIPVAALVVSGPALRLGLSDAARIGVQLRAEADRVTEATGGQPPG